MEHTFDLAYELGITLEAHYELDGPRVEAKLRCSPDLSSPAEGGALEQLWLEPTHLELLDERARDLLVDASDEARDALRSAVLNLIIEHNDRTSNLTDVLEQLPDDDGRDYDGPD